MSKKLKKFFLFALILFLFPFRIFASVEITEILYAAEGADDGREWIEVRNTGSDTIHFSLVRFSESGINHRFTDAGGGLALSPGAFAVVVSDPQKFLENHSGFSGILFDSSFSLSDKGEELQITQDGTTLDSVSYSSEWGAKGDGNSLQKVSGKWGVALPTPGKENAGDSTSSGGGALTSEHSSAISQSSSNLAISQFPVEPQIFSNAGDDRNGVAGELIVFHGKSWGLKNEPLANAKYSWNFGDGASASGQKVTHAYRHLGKYVVVLNVSSGEYMATDRVNMSVTEPDLFISNVFVGQDGFIEISNNASEELNLSFWRLSDGTLFFDFPEGTILSSKSKVKFENVVTKLFPVAGASLYYPNGRLAVNSTSQKYLPKNLPVVAPLIPAGEKKNVPIGSSKIQNDTTANVAEASVADGFALPEKNSKREGISIFYWALGFLLVAVSGGLIFLRKDTEPKGLAESFEIIEEKIQNQ